MENEMKEKLKKVIDRGHSEVQETHFEKQEPLYNGKPYSEWCKNIEWIENYKDYLKNAKSIWDNHGKNESTLYGVDKTTVRAMSNGNKSANNGPLKTYNNWAESELNKIPEISDRFNGSNDKETFKCWHAELVEALIKHWNENSIKNTFIESNPHFVAHPRKLVDLFVRDLRRTNCPNLTNAILKFGHIPLDRKSLSILNITSLQMDPTKKPPGVKKAKKNNDGHSMGDIKTIPQYEYYQEIARDICKKVIENSDGSFNEINCNPLLLDIYIWNNPICQLFYNGGRPTK